MATRAPIASAPQKLPVKCSGPSWTSSFQEMGSKVAAVGDSRFNVSVPDVAQTGSGIP